MFLRVIWAIKSLRIASSNLMNPDSSMRTNMSTISAVKVNATDAINWKIKKKSILNSSLIAYQYDVTRIES